MGQRMTSAKVLVTTDAIKEFARQFDPQPFHLDEAAAANSMLGGLAASGWHTAALTMRLLVGGGAPIAGGVIGAGVEITWPRPRVRETSCRSSVRLWRLRRPAQSPIAASSYCAARHEIKKARSFRL